MKKILLIVMFAVMPNLVYAERLSLSVLQQQIDELTQIVADQQSTIADLVEQVSYDPHPESTPGVETPQAALDDLYSIKVNRAGDTIDGSLLIQGDLTVNGNTTTINTATLETEDNIVQVNTYPPQVVPLLIDGGLEVFRGGTEPNAQIIWDESADQWNIGLVGNPFLSAGPAGHGLNVIGDISATTKSFVIDHPNAQPPAGVSKLVHAVLEGPEHGVYYRGEATLDAAGQTIITLPAYFEDLTELAGRTVLLTAQGITPFALSASAIAAGEFTVYGQPGGAFTWEVKAVRKDIPALVVER